MSTTNTSATSPRSGAEKRPDASPAKALIGAVGATPLLELDDPAFELPPDVRLFTKLEYVNPGGSIKDRPVSRIIARALESGALQGRRLLDSYRPVEKPIAPASRLSATRDCIFASSSGVGARSSKPMTQVRTVP